MSKGAEAKIIKDLRVKPGSKEELVFKFHAGPKFLQALSGGQHNN